jgi:hypothetical protein
MCIRNHMHGHTLCKPRQGARSGTRMRVGSNAMFTSTAKDTNPFWEPAHAVLWSDATSTFASTTSKQSSVHATAHLSIQTVLPRCAVVTRTMRTRRWRAPICAKRNAHSEHWCRSESQRRWPASSFPRFRSLLTTLLNRADAVRPVASDCASHSVMQCTLASGKHRQ